MQQEIQPFQAHHHLTIPASKSYLQRYITLASFYPQTSIIRNINYCNDVLACIDACKHIGAQIHTHPEYITIKGIQPIPQHQSIQVNVQESGLSARMLGIILPVLFNDVTINGTGSILHRSQKELIDVLEQAGCIVQSNHSALPLNIQHFANYHFIQLSHTNTSQIITGLLFAAAISQNESHIFIQHPTSIPYIQISLYVAKQFGIKIEHHTDYTEYHIPARQNIQSIDVTVESDWSNAAFFAVMAALSGECILNNLSLQSLQGDKKIVEILKQCGAYIKWINENTLFIKKQSLQPFETDLTHYPDLFPPVCALAAGIQGTSIIKGLSRLFNKESNRAKSILTEFLKLGIDIHIDGDSFIIQGKKYINGGVVSSQNDHRIAMACATMASISKSPIIIENADAIQKSYPNFFNHLFNQSV